MNDAKRAIREHDTRDGDSGFTVLELVIAIGIFTIFIALILGTTVTLARSVTRTQLIAESSNSIITVFGVMDRQARYADAINSPGEGASGYRYIEFRTPKDSSARKKTTCTQWRYLPEEGRIESRQWTDDAGNPESTPWTTRMSQVIDEGGLTYPFEFIPVLSQTTGPSMQQLVLAIHAGNKHLDAGAAMSTSYVARNSSYFSSSNALDGLGGSKNPVCHGSLGAGTRP